MNILEEIIAYKKTEVEKSKEKLPLDKLKSLVKAGFQLAEKPTLTFSNTLREKTTKNQIALIAEIKKASPSKGIIKENFNHIKIAQAYKNGGATCLSVLTDKKYFQGNLSYIKEIKSQIDLPILRKDFIIDPYQIYESIYHQADCILLIVGALDKNRFKMLFELSCENKIDVLIETHDEREMEAALDINPQIIGINNRNLKTFETNLQTTITLMEKYKRDLKDKIVVSESGIFKSEDIELLMEHNIHAFLVGEGLIKQENIEEATRNLIKL